MRTGPTCGAPVACLRKDCTIWKTIEGRILTITNPMILLSILFIALAIAVSHWCAAEAGLSPHPQGTTSASFCFRELRALNYIGYDIDGTIMRKDGAFSRHYLYDFSNCYNKGAVRWHFQLAQYDFKGRHIKDMNNFVANALS